jgi:2-desacetyl-2-hydroxyethyl bacteriochlorophyllide A dehydrogenase
MKSRYIVFPEPNTVDLWEEEIGSPESGEVLCAADKSLISIGTETTCLRGGFDPGTLWADWVQYPFRPGYSMAARIVAVGKDVDTLSEGDRVAVWTPHQQYFKAPAAEAYRVPEGVSDEDATWSCLANTTQVGVRRADLKLGETVGIVGLGILGQLVVQYLWLSGARRIVVIDPVQSRLELAKDHGATHMLAMDASRARQEIAAITDGRMLDAAFDITGHPAVLAPCTQLVRKLGRVILLGDTPNPSQQHLGPSVVSHSIAILGIHGTMSPEHPSAFNPWIRSEIIALFFDYLLQGRMRVADLVTSRHSPTNAPSVYASLAQDRSAQVGVIFDWNLV